MIDNLKNKKYLKRSKKQMTFTEFYTQQLSLYEAFFLLHDQTINDKSKTNARLITT